MVETETINKVNKLDVSLFEIDLTDDWFKKDDILELSIHNSVGNKMVILSNPKRVWWKLVFQFLTLGFYKAPWTYKVKPLE